MRALLLVGLVPVLVACDDDFGGDDVFPWPPPEARDAESPPAPGIVPSDPADAVELPSVPRTPAPARRLPDESLQCVAIGMGRLDTVLFPGATIITGPAFEPEDEVSSMGLVGNHVVACEGGLAIRIEIATGNVERSEVFCDALTGDEHSLIAKDYVELTQYASWDALLGRRPFAREARADALVDVVRMALFHDQLIGIRRFDRNEIGVYALDGSRVSTVQLQRAPASFTSLATASDGRLLMLDERGLEVFDLFTGTLLERDRWERERYDAIACRAVAWSNRSDTCTGKTDGVYCSTRAYGAGFRCRSGAVSELLQCETGYCQLDGIHAATLGDQLACTADGAAWDSCDGKGDGTYCSEIDTWTAYTCTAGVMTEADRCGDSDDSCISNDDGTARYDGDQLDCHGDQLDCR